MNASFEILEARRMMAAQPMDPWYVDGTSGIDTITIHQAGDMISVTNNGVTTTRRASAVKIGGTSSSGPPTWLPGILKIVVHSMNGNDVISADNTVLRGLEVYAGNGNDSVIGGAISDTIYGGSGPAGSGDQFSTGFDTINGNDGDDQLFGSYNVAGELHGGNGHDRLTGFGLADRIYGDDGNDTVNAGAGNDSVYGGNLNDSIRGEAGNDSVYGQAGADSLDGGADNDLLSGGTDDDNLVGGAGSDNFAGGGGADTVSYADYATSVHVQIGGFGNGNQLVENDFVGSDVEVARGGSANDTLVGSNNAEKFYGGAGRDEIWGSGGADSLYGDTGNDIIRAGEGDDRVYGGDNDDRLYAGGGADSVYGNDGSDILITIGGGTTDREFGNAGVDSFWVDAGSNELIDAESAETTLGVHRISTFFGNVSKELNGQNLPDPAVTISATGYDNFLGNPLFGSQGPRMEDVRQGGVGDCSFAAGVASVARAMPQRIHEAIVDLGDNTYAVRYRAVGQDVFIRIDHQLPTFWLYPTDPVYSKLGNQNSMWCPLMEKAYATLRGGYANLDHIPMTEPYTKLAMNTIQRWTGNDSQMLIDMANYLASGRVITAASEAYADAYEVGQQIVPNHAYTVVSVNSDAGYITLRNPWGSDAGFEDGSWVQGANDGLIYLTASEFNQWFRDTTVAWSPG